MEALGAAASIAGVLSLAGQTVDGILKLQNFFKDVSSASRTIERFLHDISLLIKTIEDVRSLLSCASDALGTDLKIVALEIQLQDCSKDVYEWLRLAKDHHPGLSTGTKAGFKKFWVAANKAGVSGLEQEIRRHRHSLVASLSVLGRTLDVSNSGKLTSMSDKVDQVFEDADAFHEQTLSQLIKIDSIERRSRDNLRYCRSSKSSLQRIASSLSRLERCISGSQGVLSVLTSEHEEVTTSVVRGLPSANVNKSYQKRPLFALSGSSGESCSSRQSSAPSPVVQFKKQTSFQEEVVTRAINEEQPFDNDILEMDEDDDIDDSAIEDDDDSSEWEHSLVDEEAASTKQTILSSFWKDGRLFHSRSEAREINAEIPPKAQHTINQKHPAPNKDLGPFHGAQSRSRSQTSRLLKERMDIFQKAPLNPLEAYFGEDDMSNTASSMYETITEAFNRGSTLLPPHLRSYVVKTRLAETLKQEIRLISLHAKYDLLDTYIKPLKSILTSLEEKIATDRAKCLANGHALYPIDEIMTSCTLHDPSTGLLLPKQDTSARHGDILALRRKGMKLATMRFGSGQGWTSKLDQINGWLFNNLQNSSDNAALHRSMLPNGHTMDEKSWARSVVKFWSIDEAAMGEYYFVSSSRGAVDSWGESCGVRAPVETSPNISYKTPKLIKRVTIQYVRLSETNLENIKPQMLARKPESVSPAVAQSKAMNRSFQAS